MMRLTILLALLATMPAVSSPAQLRVAVIQMAIGGSLEVNRDRIIAWVRQAADSGARVAVFPEGALSVRSSAPEGDVPGAALAIAEAARRYKIYVLYGGWTYSKKAGKPANWMKAIGPDGVELLHYDKLWDIHDAKEPPVFRIDGVPASAIICADRWLRAIEDLPVQKGAVVSFELSNNFASEWVPGLDWYWYVPRALRNGVYVVLANSANRTPGRPEEGAEMPPRHGHSAIVAPDGKLLLDTRDDLESMLIADLDLSKATRAEALARSAHPALSSFWKAGVAPERAATRAHFVPLDSAEVELSVAVAQLPGDFTGAEAAITEAARRRADIVVLPLAAVGGMHDRIAKAARESSITVAYGEGHTAFVVGPDGTLLTRHDQLTASSGGRLDSMWFRVKRVPAVVSVGRDALWNEIAELAAVAGARLHVNVAADPVPNEAAAVVRRQIGAALSSFMTLTVMSNRAGPGWGHSVIWDDLNARAESRAEVRGLPRPESGAVKIYSAFSANLVAEAGERPELLVAARQIPGRNTYYPQRSSQFQPARDFWYVLGAKLLMSGTGTRP